MSTDPKNDLLRKSGPLGINSPVPPETVQNSTPVQAAILYQNDEQLRSIWRLEGSVETGFKGVNDRVDKVEARTTTLEDFKKSVMVLPKAIWALAGVIGLDGFARIWHSITGH